MTREHDTAEAGRHERVLGWTMRIVGFALAGLSLLFLTQDIFQGPNATYFFAISAGLGILTLITSWMPRPHEPELQRSSVADVPSPRRP